MFFFWQDNAAYPESLSTNQRTILPTAIESFSRWSLVRIHATTQMQAMAVAISIITIRFVYYNDDAADNS